MKIHTFNESGYCTQEGLFEKSQEISKTMTTLGGDGEWKSLYGVRLFVDPAGIIIKGPDTFIGRTYDDVKNLNYNDVFTVERSIARATGATNKSIDPDDPENKIAIKKATDELKEWLEKTIDIRKSEKANSLVGNDPLYTMSRDKI
jgi:hypothetical protein